MKRFFFFVILVLTHTPVMSQVMDTKLTTEADIRMTINNLGLIGNAFRGSYVQLGYPSCRYPANSSVEHLFQGGLWVGAYKSGLGPYVSTASFDSPTGYFVGGANFEFTSVSNLINERSTLPQSPFFNPLAVSHQDYVTSFTDTNLTIPPTTTFIPDHTNPLGLAVTLESYNWHYSGANSFVVLNYKIKNVSQQSLDSLHVGQYYNSVVRNVSQSQPVGTPFFNKSGSGYEDSLFMGYTFDATGDPGFTESYIGIKFLGAEKIVQGQQGQVFVPELSVNAPFKVNYRVWLFNNYFDPVFYYPPNDPEKYVRMSRGLQSSPDWDFGQPPATSIREQIRRPGNRTNVLSCGNLKSLLPGESISVAFAVVCAKKDGSDGLPNIADTWLQRRNLRASAVRAQTIYNGEDVNANGILEPVEDLNQNGRIDRYLLSDLTGVAGKGNSDPEFDIFPNPNNGSFYISISGTPELSRMEIYSASGKVVKSFMIPPSSAGRYAVSDLRPGLYFVKIQTGSKAEVKRVVVE